MCKNHGPKCKICIKQFIDRNKFDSGMTEGSVGENVDWLPSA